MSSLILSSYAQGFARNAAESEYPNRWKGLVRAFSMSLGPTGLTLFDWGGRKKHGTLQNMDPATDWVLAGDSRFGWALDFDGVDDRVNLGDLGLGTADKTLIIWLSAGSLVSERRIISNIDDTNFSIRFDGTGLEIWGGTGWQQLIATAAPVGEVVQYAFTFSGAQYVTGYKNGVGEAAIEPGTSDWGILGLGDEAEDAYGTHFLGQMMQAFVYDRVLVPAEIQDDYAKSHALFQPAEETPYATVGGAPAGGHPTMRRWGGIPHMTPGPVLAGRSW